ncbi:hypothetical protein H312_02108, partial [Anncaliia algerae PRA339]
ERNYIELTECENIEDICAKLVMKYPTLKYLTNYTKTELKEKLYGDLLEEFYLSKISPSLKIVSDFIREQYFINSFFYLLSCKEFDPELHNSFGNVDAVSYFIELDTLKFCVNMEEVYNYCVKNTFLKDYYNECVFNFNFRENDFSFLNYQFNKLHLKKYFYYQSTIDEENKKQELVKVDRSISFDKKSPKENNFSTLLKLEGDRLNIGLALSLIDSESKDKKDIFTEISNIPQHFQQKIIESTTFEEIRNILSKMHHFSKEFSSQEISLDIAMKKVELNTFMKSFYLFNDISVYYSYLKLKEQEIQNILYLAESILSDKKERIKEIILADEL